MGPLEGTKVVEFAGIGPGPFCAMMLADMGAEVIRIARPEPPNPDTESKVLNRGRREVQADLKSDAGKDLAWRLIAGADALIEGFRPGVMERLGFGPDACLARNPRLVYGRITGWGQTGPLSQAAGHDLNYIALSGALHAIGNEKPVPPLNLVGDFGGGGMLLAFGIVCALLEARRSGRGQAIDAAMTSGAALLMAMIYDFKNTGRWTNQRASNLVDGGAPFYGVYECADGKFVSIAAIEHKFLAELLARLGITEPAQLAAAFKTRTREEWCALLEGTDACFAPVLDLDEAPRHPHNIARGTFVEIDGAVQPAPAPDFSRTPARVRTGEELNAESIEDLLARWSVERWS